MSAAIPGYTVTCAKHTFEYPTLLLAKACLASWGVQGCVGNNPIAAGLAPKMVWCACSGTVGGHGVPVVVVEMAVVVVYLCFRVDGSNLRCTTPQHKFTTARLKNISVHKCFHKCS